MRHKPYGKCDVGSALTIMRDGCVCYHASIRVVPPVSGPFYGMETGVCCFREAMTAAKQR